MFNSYSSSSFSRSNNHIKLNAVSGTIIKNYKDSFIYPITLGGYNSIFDIEEGPYIRMGNPYAKIPVVVLQIMLCGENKALVELIRKDVFDTIFADKVE